MSTEFKGKSEELKCRKMENKAYFSGLRDTAEDFKIKPLPFDLK